MNDNHIIDPGKLDTRIVIRTFGALALDSMGGQVKTWSTLAELWAAWDWKTSKEQENSAQEVTVTDIVALIRYRSDVTTKMQVVYDSRTYDITGITTQGRKRYLALNLRSVA